MFILDHHVFIIIYMHEVKSLGWIKCNAHTTVKYTEVDKILIKIGWKFNFFKVSIKPKKKIVHIQHERDKHKFKKKLEEDETDNLQFEICFA